MKRLLLLLLVTLAARPLVAQTTFNTSAAQQTGERVLGSYFATDIDTVSLTNGDLKVSIPLFSLPGRELPLRLALDYDSRFYEEWWLPGGPAYGTYYWRKNTGIGGIFSGTMTLLSTTTNTNTYRLDCYWVEANGTKHKFTKTVLDNAPKQGATAMMQNQTIDSTESDFLQVKTGDYFASTPGSAELYFKNGNKMIFEADTDAGSPVVPRWTLQTTNGNKLVVTGTSTSTVSNDILLYDLLPTTDTTGRTISYSTSGSTVTVTLTAANSSSQVYSYHWTTISGVEKPGFDGTTIDEDVIDSVTLPNGKSYTLDYSSTSGMLTKITFPSGAYTRYTWARQWSGTGQGPWVVTSRIVSADGTTEKTWTYGYDWDTYNGYIWDSTAVAWQIYNHSTTVTDPTGAKVVHYFTTGGLEYETDFETSSSVVVKSIVNTWENTSSNARVETTEIAIDGGSSNSVSREFGDYNNVTRENYYDFGGALLGYKTFTYLTTNSVNSQDYTTFHMLNRLSEEDVYDASNNVKAKTQYEYDNYNTVSRVSRSGVPGWAGTQDYPGLVTSSKSWINTSDTWLTTTNRWDVVGNLVKVTDSGGHYSEIDFSDNYSDSTNRSSFAYPKRVTDPQGWYADTVYHFASAMPVSTTDTASRTTTMTYDVMNRVTETDYPGGGITTYAYDDTARTTTKQVKVDSTHVGQVITTFDKLYRPVKTETADPDGATFVDTQYDSKGRVWKTSNPYRSGTALWTETAYDAADRPSTVTAADGSTISYLYATNVTTTTDQAGNKRRYTYDGLGRMTKVEEPNPTLSTPATTNYTYNILGKLTQSTQGSQTRTWVYDSLGRMTSQTLPESGTTTFEFNAEGLLETTTDARGAASAKLYDSSHPHQAAGLYYSDTTPSVTFGYNSRGLRTSMTDGLGSVAYSYDSNTDRLTSEVRTLTGVSGTFTTSYVYNIKGDVTQMTYPSGRVVNFGYKTDGSSRNSRIASVGDGTTGLTLSEPVTYKPTGGVATRTLNPGSNAIVETFSYDDQRLQLTGIQAAKGGTTLMNFSYDYGSSSTNTGRALSRADSVQPEHSVTYAYDSTYRLTEAAAVNGSWAISWVFDTWGNRTTQTALGLASSKVGSQTSGYTSTPPTNKNTSFSYDSAGNTTNDGTHSYAYNAISQQTSMGGGTATYAYDGEGRRMKKTFSGVTTYSFYGPGGLLCEFATSSSDSSATAAASTDKTLYRTSERTGTATLFFNTSGTVIENNRTFPYGEAWLNDMASENDKKFTTYDRDQESDLDYAMNRMYASTQGRMTSPDKGRAILYFPLSFNRYLYALADPINYVDSDGREPQSPPTIPGVTINVTTPVPPPLSSIPWDLLFPRGDNLNTNLCLDGVDAQGNCTYGAPVAAPVVPNLTGTLGGIAENCSLAMMLDSECDDPLLTVSAAASPLARFLNAAAARVGAAAAAGQMVGARLVGYLGENYTKAVLGLEKNNTFRLTETLSGRYRIPDFVDGANRIIYEVKNVGYLSYTQQLVDMANWARANGWTFQIWVDKETELSGPLKAAWDSGLFKVVPNPFN